MPDPSLSSQSKPIRSFREYMRRYFPKELERREREGRCIHCGQKKPDPWKGAR